MPHYTSSVAIVGGGPVSPGDRVVVTVEGLETLSFEIQP